MELKVFQTLLSNAFVKLERKFLAAFGNIDAVLEFLESKRLKEITEMALIIIILAFPRIQIRMRLQELTSYTITSTMRVNMTALKYKWLQIFINKRHNSHLILLNLLKLEILG
jgi:hypothetical protein